MSNIVQLPDSMQRQWRIFESALQDWLKSEGCSQQEIAHSCEKLKPIYLKFAQPKQFSGDPEKILLEFNDWVQDQTFGLLATVAVRDVELFRLRGECHE